MKKILLAVEFILISTTIFCQCELQLGFLEDIEANLTGVDYSAIDAEDIDGDGDQDFLILGFSDMGLIAVLYRNDGLGNFEEVSDTPFDGVDGGALDFSDIDGDGDQDVLITGQNSNFERIAKVYVNDGTGNFSIMPNTDLIPVFRGAVLFFDIDSDGDEDLVISGLNSNESFAYIYSNDGMGNFSEVNQLEGVSFSSLSHGDVDGDSDNDLFLFGRISNTPIITVARLYLNDGVGNFTLDDSNLFEGVSWGDSEFGDIDGDSDLDLMYSGSADIERITPLYLNDGSGNFSLSSASFDGTVWGSLDLTDIDNDSDLDVLLTGENNANIQISKIYLNEGLEGFTEFSDIGLNGARRSAATVRDFNGDSGKDIVIVGNSGFYKTASYYENVSTGMYGCIDELACNYAQIAECEDSSCLYIELSDIVGENSISLGETYTYSYDFDESSTYSWTVSNGVILSGQGTSEIQVQWDLIGIGSVCVTESITIGCEGEEVCMSIDVTLEVSDFESMSYSVYPNPSNGKLKIDSEVLISYLQIINSIGSVVLADSNISVKEFVLPSGIYFLRAKLNNGEFIEEKLIIQ